ncbi:MAG TPA: hypothetical protein VER55_03680 [Ardenticatenaceae bacterium]|nr:hypothetical protein [Ardenticatenaceae bacterium]
MSETKTVLERLEALVGGWNIELRLPTEPPMMVQARASFEWLPGNFFLVYRSEADNPDFPRGESIIGCDNSLGTYSMLYSDSRGVTRLYAMSLSDGEWKLWRDDPSFPQRFTGTFSADGRTIAGRWEKSSDGTSWELDFDGTYTRV